MKTRRILILVSTLFIAIFVISYILIFLFKKYYKPYVRKVFYNSGLKIITEMRKNKIINDIGFKEIKKYYINLDRSNDRRKKIEEEFKSYNVSNFERIPACDSSQIKNVTFGDFGDIKFTNLNDTKSTINEISCSCSHLKTIKTSYDNGDNISLIMEDDVHFTLVPYWDHCLNEIIKKLPDTWELLQLCSWNKKRDKYSELYEVLQYVPKLKRNLKIIKRKKGESHCTNVYLVSRKGMEKIIKKYFKKDDEIVFTEERNVYDNEILDSYEAYYLYTDLFLRDSFYFPSTLRGEQKNLIIKNNRDSFYNNNYFESFVLLKSYLDLL